MKQYFDYFDKRFIKRLTKRILETKGYTLEDVTKVKEHGDGHWSVYFGKDQQLDISPYYVKWHGAPYQFNDALNVYVRKACIRKFGRKYIIDLYSALRSNITAHYQDKMDKAVAQLQAERDEKLQDLKDELKAVLAPNETLKELGLEK
ncbi:MAG: hypothetical protein E7378_02730 [Clostridiales bacterium]|nr:hypothetical protein [Clostridiales bacterium]